jgi:hypothetical protein
VALAIEVSLQGLDETFAPQGEAFAAVLRDISTWGVGLLSAHPISAPFLALRVPGSEPDAVGWVLKVLRCQPLGEFHDVGASFVSDTK